MMSLRVLLVHLLPLLAPVVVLAHDPAHFASPAYSAPPSELVTDPFHELLSQLPASSIRSVLRTHLRPKFQHGVYEFDRDALEALHKSDPELASQLASAAAAVSTARLELVRRQEPTNGTDTTTAVETKTRTFPVTESISTVVVPSTTTERTRTKELPTTDIETTSTSTPAEESTTITSSFSFDTTSSTSSSTTSTFSTTTSPTTPKPKPTRTKATPTPPSTTSSPSPTDSDTDSEPTTPPKLTSTTVLETTTLSNGKLSTVTSVQIISPTTAEEASSTDEAPSLQTGAAEALVKRSRAGGEVLALIGCVVGMAAFL